MNFILRILLGLGIAGVGVFVVMKTKIIIGFVGPINWAERNLGGGGTNLMYKLIGVVICLIGFIVATDMWDAFLKATLGSVVR